jgi:NAD+ synthase
MTPSEIQSTIIHELGVKAGFDAEMEIARRVLYLREYLRSAGLQAYVLGISGGVDSLAAALLARKAVLDLRSSSYPAHFIAVRLPYGVQADENDAQSALDVIQPDRVLVIDVKPPTDAAFEAIHQSSFKFPDPAQADFLIGNIKARQRMIAQFTLASATRGLVIGTDHAAEALMGFFTKFGDGAADILPLAGLNKRRVRAIASKLGAPEQLVSKVPTADLEGNAPLRPDEEAYGVTYDEIDDFLEGKTIAPGSRDRILEAYRKTAHKRALPSHP